MSQHGESILFNSIATQLTATNGWKIMPKLGSPVAYGNTASFEMLHTRTLYHGVPYPVTCTFEFDLVLHLSPAPFTNNVIDELSAMVESLLVTFFSGAYVPPPVVVGDDLRVDSVSLVSRDHIVGGEFEFAVLRRQEALTTRNVESRPLRIYHCSAECTLL